jgi:Acyl-CoA carboxylase epsilon subunit
VSEPGVAGPTLRIERGRPDEEELAAVTIVLCSVLAAREAADTEHEPPDVPSWWLEPAGRTYRSPYCWR